MQVIHERKELLNGFEERGLSADELPEPGMLPLVEVREGRVVVWVIWVSLEDPVVINRLFLG